MTITKEEVQKWKQDIIKELIRLDSEPWSIENAKLICIFEEDLESIKYLEISFAVEEK